MQKYKFLILFFLVLTILFVFLLGSKLGINIKNIINFISHQGILAPVIFLLVYTIGPVFFMPITPLSATAGVLFGPLWGTVFSVIGATSGACATFFVSRYLLRDFICKKESSQITFVQNRIEKDGWKFVMLARITPIFPFNIQNYLFGVTKIRFITYLWASALSLIPGTFVYVYIGSTGKSALSGDTDTIYKIILAFVLLFIFSITPYILGKITKHLSGYQ